MTSRVLLAALVCGSLFIASPVQSQPPLCLPHDNVVDVLGKKHGETVVWVGLDAAGQLVEVFASEGGTWTLAVSAPGGLTCLLSAGTKGQSVKPKAPESGS